MLPGRVLSYTCVTEGDDEAWEENADSLLAIQSMKWKGGSRHINRRPNVPVGYSVNEQTGQVDAVMPVGMPSHSRGELEAGAKLLTRKAEQLARMRAKLEAKRNGK